jgi:hypothetical protein
VVYPQREAIPTSQSASPFATTLPDAAAIECILGIFRGLRFPPKGKATAFSFPFVFKGNRSKAPARAP